MSKARAKGTAFETAVVRYLRDHGHPGAYRPAQAGRNDKGDVCGVPGWTLELKAATRLDLAAALGEAKVEARRARTDHYAAIIKRVMGKVEDAYVVLELAQFAAIINGGVGNGGGPDAGGPAA